MESDLEAKLMEKLAWLEVGGLGREEPVVWFPQKPPWSQGLGNCFGAMLGWNLGLTGPHGDLGHGSHLGA